MLFRSVPKFPDTVRIILTGFTDVEDLVDAINAGQVYRYITKPWNPDELKLVVDQAASTYDLLKQRGEAIDLLQNQNWLVMEMANIAQSESDVKAALPAIASAVQKVTGADGAAVHLIESEGLGNDVGTAGTLEIELIKKDPLVMEAISTKDLKHTADSKRVSDADAKVAYESAEISAHGVVPVLFRDVVIAVVSLQWQKPRAFTAANQDFVTMAAQQIALTLACL